MPLMARHKEGIVRNEAEVRERAAGLSLRCIGSHVK